MKSLCVIAIVTLLSVVSGGPSRSSSYKKRNINNEIVQLPPNNDQKLSEEFAWKQLDYTFPTAKERQRVIDEGIYVPNTGTPIDVAVHYTKEGQRRVFSTIPRFGTGIPYTLAEIVQGSKGPDGPKIEAFPDYQWHKNTHQGEHCNRITSVFRVAIDPCNRMWVLDTGKIGTTQYCPPQLLVFDLNTDTLFHRYKFPARVYTNESLFITPIVDTRDPPPAGTCLNTRVYIADVTAYGLIVYDSTQDTSWRVEHETMRNDARLSNFTIAGESFSLTDGIFGLSVTPPNFSNLRRFLFYHSLGSNLEVIVPLDILDNMRLWRRPNSNANAFQIVGARNDQASAQAIDSRGNLFFGLVSTIGIGSWNFMQPWNGNNSAVIIQPDTLQFTSGLKVVRNPQNQEELWMNTNRFQKIMAGTLNTNEINFRIQKTLTTNLVC